MHKKIISWVVAILFALLVLSGCSGEGTVIGAPAVNKPLWSEVQPIEDPHNPELSIIDEDLALEGFGQLLAFSALSEDRDTILTLAWQENVASLYILEMSSLEVTSLGAVALSDSVPRLEAVVWPWVLLATSNEEGDHSWVLLDCSGEKAEVAWYGDALVPDSLRQRPVWHNGEGWYLGPVTGPVITAIPSGKTLRGFEEALNPVVDQWPHWAGGVPGSHWFLLPRENGCRLQNLKTGKQIAVPTCDEAVWNHNNTHLALLQGTSLELVDITGKTSTPIDADVLPRAPLWSDDSDKIYYFKGTMDCFGPRYKELWAWTEDGGSSQLFTLPGSWACWRLLVAGDGAVLASAGDQGQLLVYFDAAGEKIYELETGIYKWWGGRLVTLFEDGRLVAFSPGCDPRVILRDVKDLEILALIGQYLFYSLDGVVYIKPLP